MEGKREEGGTGSIVVGSIGVYGVEGVKCSMILFTHT